MSSKIILSADSTCDLSPELLKRYDVAIQPLYIVRDDASLRDGVDIRPTDIFAYVEQAGKLLKTAAVSVEDYIELFRRRTEDGSEVVHITISAEMSACYQNACLAAREVPGVYPVDSRNLSTGMGLVVIAAAKRAQAGESGADIQKAMEELTANPKALEACPEKNPYIPPLPSRILSPWSSMKPLWHGLSLAIPSLKRFAIWSQSRKVSAIESTATVAFFHPRRKNRNTATRTYMGIHTGTFEKNTIILSVTPQCSPFRNNVACWSISCKLLQNIRLVFIFHAMSSTAYP